MRRLLRENWYRDVWLLLISAVVLLSLLSLGNATTQIQQGRRATAGITCAVSASVVKAGRLTIVTSAEAPLPPKLEALLRRYDYPPLSVRRAKAQRSADAYTRSINEEIVRAAGVQAKKVIAPAKLPNGEPNPDAGTLNCAKLRELAHIK